uniref:Lrp/AsnC family transcriptional regulator n=1 Tax=Pararhizobium sp. IMCC3301 TaxID=3067904 RepID=UPI002740CDB2|nr:Lrp/AsnC family transcriptional regulator [Pararhizobium sp. IMCC3301]
MTEKIDPIDRAILRILQRDATVGVDALAEQVHLSRNACWRRVKQLEARKIIRDRVVLLDPDSVDLGLSVIVLIKTNSHDADWLRTFREAVLAMPEILGAHRMTGELDYVLRVRVSSVKAYDRFYQELIRRIDISDVSASFVMEDIKDTTILPV